LRGGLARGTILPASLPSSGERRRGYHLNYEIWMLEETYQKLPNADQVINNALIEAFCLHARNLIEFFAEEGRKYTTEEYRAFCHISTTKLKAIKKKINIHISHMIYEGRTTNNADKINHPERAEVLNILSEEIMQFKTHLLQECIQNVVRDLPRIRVPASVISFSSGHSTTTAATLSLFWSSSPGDYE
jgi:hypothetical protein